MNIKTAKRLILLMAENPEKALDIVQGGEALIAVSTVLVRNGLLEPKAKGDCADCSCSRCQ